MSTSDKVTKFDNLTRSLNKIIFGNENEDVTLDGVTKPTWSKWLKSKSTIIDNKADKSYVDNKADKSYVDNKADKSYVDNALGQFQSGSSKFYATLADANANIANIMPKLAADTVRDLVNIGEVANGGTWYKANSSATRLTKSPYDSLIQSRKYTNSTLAEGYIKNYPTETALKASLHDVSEMRARAEDTRKIWRWNRTSVEGVTPLTGTWTDTGLSDKELAIRHSTNELRKHIDQIGNVSNLFEFNDINDKTVAVIRPNGDIANDQYSLNKIGEKTDQLVERHENQLKSSLAKSLFDFEDDSGKTVVSFIEDGDIKTPRGSFYQNLDEIDAIKMKTQNIESNAAESLHEFTDNTGSVTHVLLADGNILFNGGRSLVKELDALNDSQQNTRKTSISTLEYLTPDFMGLMMQGMAFNGSTARASIFIGVAQQNHSFNRDDFLNLKITQSAPILIETPYYPGVSFNFPDSEVVHPYICEFKERIHGYKYLMIANPFHKTFDVYENPVVYGSNDLQSFDMLDKFDQPLASAFRSFYHDYNSDSSAAYDHTTGEFCLIYRHTIHPESISYAYSNLYIRRTTDFVNWTESKKLLKVDGSDKFDPVSLSIVFNPSLNKWMLFGVAYNDANQRQELCYQLSDQLDKGWGEINFATFENNVDHILFWHQEVRYCGDKFICIVNDVLSETDAKDGKGDLYLGVSDDGITWKFSQTSIFSGAYNNPYKASISPFVENNQLGFNVVWTDNGNEVDGWKLYSTKTAKIEVI